MTDRKNRTLETVYEGRLISVNKHPVQLREGGSTTFDIVSHPGGAVILAVNSENQLCLLKQWREAIHEHIWELPAGCLEPNEDPAITAARELQEETGFSAKNITPLGKLVPSPGYSDEVLYLFLAEHLTAGNQQLDAAEVLEVHWKSKAEIEKMIASNEITDAKTIAGICIWTNRN